MDGITDEVDRKFLTLAWWILHIGWKDSERVRRGVEEVFEGFVRSPVLQASYMLITLQGFSQDQAGCDRFASSS